MQHIRPREIRFEIGEGDFIYSLNRPPKDQEEFDEWARYVEKGLRNGHIDWDILYRCANEASHLQKRGPEVV